MRGLRHLEWRSPRANGCEGPRLLLRLYCDQARKTLSRAPGRFPSGCLGPWSAQRPECPWPPVVRVHQRPQRSQHEVLEGGYVHELDDPTGRPRVVSPVRGMSIPERACKTQRVGSPARYVTVIIAPVGLPFRGEPPVPDATAASSPDFDFSPPASEGATSITACCGVPPGLDHLIIRRGLVRLRGTRTPDPLIANPCHRKT